MVKILGNEIYEFICGRLSSDEKNDFEVALEAYYLKKHHLKRLAHVSERILPYIKPNDRILDLGSDGIFPYIAKNFIEDIEAHAVSKSSYDIIFTEDGHACTRENCGIESENISQENIVRLQKCDLDKERLPFEDNSIDVVTCFEVLEHLYTDPMHLMLEAKRVLKKPDGLFFLSTPNINSLKALKRMLNMESPYFWPPYCITDLEIGHVKEYSVNELKLLFEKSGFSILDMETFNHGEDDLFSHDRLYQAGNVLGTRKSIEQAQLDERLYCFLDSINWDSRYQGDYAFIMSKWKTDTSDRYYFPLYESY